MYPSGISNSDIKVYFTQYFSSISILYKVICCLSFVSCILWTIWLAKDSPKGRKYTVYATLYEIILSILVPILILVVKKVELNKLKAALPRNYSFDASNFDSSIIH